MSIMLINFILALNMKLKLLLTLSLSACLFTIQAQKKAKKVMFQRLFQCQIWIQTHPKKP